MLILAPDLARDMRGLLERAYPREGCGLLIGRWMARSAAAVSVDPADPAVTRILEIAAIHPARNFHSENPFHRYVAPREDYEAAEACALALRATDPELSASPLEVVGVYHGHPDSPAVPSSIDADFAFPGWVYVIVELRGGRAVETAAWLRGDSCMGPDWIRLEIAEPGPLPPDSEELSSDARSR